MRLRSFLKYIILLCTISTGIFSFSMPGTEEDIYLAYRVDPAKQSLQLFWKDDKGQVLQSLGNVKKYAESKNQTLLFAMNGGMYTTDHGPLGLFIQDGKTIKSVNKRQTAYGNFYMQPNGIFSVDKNNKAAVCRTDNFLNNGRIKYATQSGPMLVIDGKIHPGFSKGSSNVQIRNGVGILPNGSVLFAMSKTFVNLYDFATYFKNQGCKNALFLDGAICQAYLPEKKWMQTGGDFGVIIGVTKTR